MRRLLLVLACVLCSIAPAVAYEPGTLTLTILDVGQADAILVQAPNGASMLVDAAEPWNASAVTACLEDERITHLAYAVGTHDHEDHIGGMVEVLSEVTVDEYLNNGRPLSYPWAQELRAFIAAEGIPSRAVTAGDTIALDPANVTVTVLNPPPVPGTSENEASIALLLDFGTQSFLLAGDTGTTAEGWMLASNLSLGAQVLKVGHHGSSSSTGSSFVAAVDPSVAVITSGRPGPSAYPALSVVKRLQDSDGRVYSTAASGTVRITATRTGFDLVTVLGPELPITVPGAVLPPSDPDFDGAFEDVNGNGRLDFADVVSLFNNLDWIAATEPVARFDFNRNGRMDFADVVSLFNSIG
jgi:beta-lactamase superfamily II metal-dependent hydrolase